MRRLILVLAMIGVTVLLASGAALAITYGLADGNRHPNVGALVDRFGAYCSGTLVPGTTDTTLNPSGGPVFLTAAHCDYDEATVRVTFDSIYTAGSSPRIRGTFHADPNEYQNGHDIAVVTFDQTDPDYSILNGITPARLPEKGALSGLPKGQKFTAVGYGATSADSDPDGERRYAVSSLTSIQPYYLSLSQNAKKDNGGTCYGDSGGPNFFGEYPYDYDNNLDTENVPVIASITNTGDAMCKATNKVLRLDTEAAQGTEADPGFLRKYVNPGAFVSLR